jgi:uncharacterized peroxidase-related enzyme
MDDLRAEVDGKALADTLERGWREADLPDRVRAILALAEKAAENPRSVRRADVEEAKAAGLDDAAVLEVVSVVGLFAYFNTVVDALGVEDEPEWGNP